MIDLYFSPTPNGQKLHLFFEETGLAHRVVPVRLSAGEQFTAEFQAISPNTKIPAIVDHEPTDGTAPLALFESGAILVYLADKIGRLLPPSGRERHEVLQWLFWQVSGLGPMAGQAGYFRVYAARPVEAAIDRYTRELARLYGVLDRRLEGREYIAGRAYSIADIAAYPWIVPHRALGQDLDRHPNLQRWFDAIAARPATQRAYAGVVDVYTRPTRLSTASREALFGKATATATH